MMRQWMTLVEEAFPKWHSWLRDHPNPISLLDDPQPLYAILPANQRYAMTAIASLKEWLAGPRKVYRVIGISDWNNQFGGDDRAAAHAWAETVQADPSNALGCYWSRYYSGDPHTKTGGASMGHDVDAEGFPVVLGATVDPSSVVWGDTILQNIAYPHEQEITIEGTVHMRYVAVDDEYTDFAGDRPTGPFVA